MNWKLWNNKEEVFGSWKFKRMGVEDREDGEPPVNVPNLVFTIP